MNTAPTFEGIIANIDNNFDLSCATFDLVDVWLHSDGGWPDALGQLVDVAKFLGMPEFVPCMDNEWDCVKDVFGHIARFTGRQSLIDYVAEAEL